MRGASPCGPDPLLLVQGQDGGQLQTTGPAAWPAPQRLSLPRRALSDPGLVVDSLLYLVGQLRRCPPTRLSHSGWACGNGCFLIAIDVEAERVTGRVEEDAHVVLRLVTV